MISFLPEQWTVFPLTAHHNATDFFCQLQVYENLSCPCRIHRCLHAKPTLPRLEVTQAKIVDTRVGFSLEGQNLTGNKLLLSGRMHTKLVLSQSCCNGMRDVVVNRALPFSTFIVIPYMTRYPEHIYIGYEIEDYEAVVIQGNYIYTVFSLLLTYNSIEM